MKAVILILTLAGCAGRTNYKWSDSNKALAVTTVMTMGLDYYQTTNITRDCRESNPVIGLCGENVHPSVYFPVVTAGALILANGLPSNARSVLLGLLTGVQLKATYVNNMAGY